MNDQLIKRWHSVVKYEDTVYFLGDFAFGSPSLIPSLVASLSGQKHLIYGNHDVEKLNWHRKADWLSINEHLHIIDGEYKIWMAHIPLQTAEDKTKYIRPMPLEDYDICLCGHVHEKYMVNDLGSINVGCDVFGFIPRTLEEILEAASKAPIFDSSVPLKGKST
jgi:calcineurin-like phosphoesterase family protein